ncbi:hypothetical protein GLAREA_01352 [Glarea lozoyensis ATCC 20868]|uniref:Uncharacterized protein n=1 Tax=Glarea lozoyensis (strain ATCC 20868 / MF5171) TaxID=1116229 RepID=S3CHW1_GLAL2|nr:uncharacterized protein GLAREA_01352 [Glarea lozoyensis ATCC 20868]EPE25440.1 hypothetical protein GLAREA_01352 [Glarea lozoyensis ATCC 20868]
MWYLLSQIYSRRDFTFVKDCLPAIAGFVRQFQGALKDDFCAGLWKRDMLRGLVWVTDAQHLSDEELMEATARKSWPSWSWLSSFSMELLLPLRHLTHRSTHFAKVIDVEIDYVTRDVFGDIEGGKLILEAPSHLFELVLEDDCHPPWGIEKLAHITLTEPAIRLAHTGRSVVIPRTRAVHQFAFVKLMEVHETIPIQVLLLLQRLNTNRATQVVYRRVALVCTMPLAKPCDDFLGEFDVGFNEQFDSGSDNDKGHDACHDADNEFNDGNHSYANSSNHAGDGFESGNNTYSECDNLSETSITEELKLVERLRSAANREVVRGFWPTWTFTII